MKINFKELADKIAKRHGWKVIIDKGVNIFGEPLWTLCFSEDDSVYSLPPQLWTEEFLPRESKIESYYMSICARYMIAYTTCSSFEELILKLEIENSDN